MALVVDVGGSERWVKEGAQVGHFVIGAIRRGSISYRNGDQVRQMTVEPASSLPNIVRDTRPGVRQVSAAVGSSPLAAVDGNSVEVSGN